MDCKKKRTFYSIQTIPNIETNQVGQLRSSFLLHTHWTSWSYEAEKIAIKTQVWEVISWIQKILLKTYERGVGMTMACGSGACASFAFAKKMGFVSSVCEVVFSIGNLIISCDNDNSITMEGSAIMVADGLYYDY